MAGHFQKYGAFFSFFHTVKESLGAVLCVASQSEARLEEEAVNISAHDFWDILLLVSMFRAYKVKIQTGHG